jgi:mannose-6-phosphate isomerase-like protein (cupin superfamily)
MPPEAMLHLFRASGPGPKVDVGCREIPRRWRLARPGARSLPRHRPSAGRGPALHVHHSREKTFIVLAGRLACKCGERRIVGGVGRTLRWPAALAA